MIEGRGVLPITTHAYLLPFGDEVSWRNLMYTVGTLLPDPEIGEPGEREYLHVAFVLTPPDTAVGGIAMYRPWIRTATAVCGISGNADFDVDTCAHEIGHALGLNHANCLGRTSPAPWSSRLPHATEEAGWYASRNTMVRSGTAEMMSYCDPRWPSITAFHYVLHGRHD